MLYIHCARRNMFSGRLSERQYRYKTDFIAAHHIKACTNLMTSVMLIALNIIICFSHHLKFLTHVKPYQHHYCSGYPLDTLYEEAGRSTNET